MLIKENTGLIVVDIQGKLARLVHENSTLISNCEKLIKGVQALNLPIIWLEQNPEKLGATVEELSSLLNSQPSPLPHNLQTSLPCSSSDKQHPIHQPITKFTFDACKEEHFIQAVNNANVDTWLICGIEAHICVYQTALGLKGNGFCVQLVSDCVSSRTLDNKNLGVSKLLSHGIELTGLEMCLFELVKDCREPEFKEILTLIK